MKKDLGFKEEELKGKVKEMGFRMILMNQIWICINAYNTWRERRGKNRLVYSNSVDMLEDTLVAHADKKFKDEVKTVKKEHTIKTLIRYRKIYRACICLMDRKNLLLFERGESGA